MRSVASPALKQRWTGIKHVESLGPTVLSSGRFALARWRTSEVRRFGGCVISQCVRFVSCPTVCCQVPWHGTLNFDCRTNRLRSEHELLRSITEHGIGSGVRPITNRRAQSELRAQHVYARES